MPARIPKWLWLLLIILVPILGSIIWLFFKYRNVLSSDYRVGGGAGRPNPFNRNTQSGPIAPDDDPEFLARLEARNRRQAYEERKRQENGDKDDEPRKNPDEDEDDGGLYGSRF